MKKIHLIPLSLFLLFASCKKSDNGISAMPNPSGLLFIPNMEGINSRPYPLISNVWGILTAVTVRGNYTDSNGTIPIYANDAVAYFHSTTGRENASGVAINNYLLDTIVSDYQLFYQNQNTSPSDTLNFTTNNNWVVTGNENVPGISYNYTDAFPSFLSALPLSLSSSANYTITFDASNTLGADSVYISLCGNGSNFLYVISSKPVSALDGTATIDSSDIKFFQSGGFQNVYLEIFLYKYTVKPFGNKQFAFVKLDEVIQNVTIN